MSIINGRPPIPLRTSSNGVQLGPVTLAFQLFCKNMTLEGDGHEHRVDKNVFFKLMPRLLEKVR